MMSQVGKNIVMILSSVHPLSTSSHPSPLLLLCPPLQLFEENLQRSVQVSAPSEVQVSHPPRS